MDKKEASPSRYKLVIDPKFAVEQRDRLPQPGRRNFISRSVDSHSKQSMTDRLPLSINTTTANPEGLLPKIHPQTTIRQPNSRGSLSNLRASVSSTRADDSPIQYTQERKILKPQPFFPTEVRAMIQRALPQNKPHLRSTKILEEDAEVKKEILERHQFYKEYKRIAELGETNYNSQSPAHSYLKNCFSMNLLPYSFKLYHDNGAVKKIKIGHYRVGNNYASALVEAISHSADIEKLEMRENRISDSNGAALIHSLGEKIKSIDFSFNALGTKAIAHLARLISSSKSLNLVFLNLEANKLGDQNIRTLSKALARGTRLKVLNLSANDVTDAVAKELGYACSQSSSLQQLYLHWNRIKSKGGAELFEELNNTRNLKLLDMSSNKMGSSLDARAAKKIADFVSKHEELVHFDLSHNSFTKAECQIIADGLIKNRSILGLHMIGNHAEVDSLGFLVPQDDLNIEAQALWTRIPINKKTQPSKKMIEYKACNKCWVCEGWREVRFVWVNTNPDLTEPEPVYLHLSFEDCKGDLMLNEGNNTYSVTRACPPGRIEFFFSILDEKVILDPDVQITELNDLQKLERALSSGVVQKLDVTRVNTMDVERFDVLGHKSFDAALDCRPRPEPKIWVPKIKKQKRPTWLFEASVFRDWKSDTEDVERNCFEYDWENSKIPKLIKNPQEMEPIKHMLAFNYKYIRACYKFIAGITPLGNVFCIPLNSYTDSFINKTGIVDNKTLKLPDVDRNFIATNYMEKKNSLNPTTALVRFQFLEMIVRLAQDKFVYNKTMNTLKEGLEAILNEYVLPYCKTFDHTKWRKQNLWNEECDRVYKANWSFLIRLYDEYCAESKKRAGGKKFVSIDDFHNFCSKAQLLDHFITDRDPSIIYNLSMMTVVNELESERGMQMSLVEFIEAIGRIAEKIDTSLIDDYRGLHSKIIHLFEHCSKTLYNGSFEIVKPPPFED